ncbi:MAG: hypothetical protein KC544_08225, partial [Gemmatimonadetes bacterium]|nr:hypothetical protein [Gemmatimonadota bacterium]
IAQEFGRGIRARMSMHGENAVLALGRLMARNRRRYGGYIVHVGVVCYFVAAVGQGFKIKESHEMVPGESVTLASPFGHEVTFTFLGVSQYAQLNRQVSAATLEVSRGGTPLGTTVSEKRQHVDSFGQRTFEPSTEVGLISNLQEDLYVVYAGTPDGTERSRFEISIIPLVNWFWIGGVILLAGGLLAMWPGGPQIRTKRAVLDDAQAGYGVPLTGAEVGA